MPLPQGNSRNVDESVVLDFGREWDAFDQSKMPRDEQQRLFKSYFSLFHFDSNDEGFDVGCGSGRWAAMVAPHVRRLHCIDPAEAALAVARRNLVHLSNVEFHCAAADSIPLADGSQDFGYSLGVLHHIPDTAKAMADCVRKLKPGGQFVVYLYYRFDTRPLWFRAIWRASDVARRGISHMPFPLKRAITTAIAAGIYFPLARIAQLLEKGGISAIHLPLYAYRSLSFYTMRTDALDRFGTKLEQRFTKTEIATMMRRSGLKDIQFSDDPPFWIARGSKA